MKPIDPAIFNTSESAQYIKSSVPTMKRWRQQGGGPLYIKYGEQSIRYRKADLDQWLSEQASYRQTAEAHLAPEPNRTGGK